jgi:hypothetical protein
MFSKRRYFSRSVNFLHLLGRLLPLAAVEFLLRCIIIRCCVDVVDELDEFPFNAACPLAGVKLFTIF